MIEVATELGRRSAQIMIDVIDYHADVTSLPDRAAAAGIQRLALYHMVPAQPGPAEGIFMRGLLDNRGCHCRRGRQRRSTIAMQRKGCGTNRLSK